MPIPMRQCTTKARRKTIKSSKELKKPVNRFSNLLRSRRSKKSKKRKMKFLAKTCLKGRYFGSKSLTGSSVQKDIWSFQEEIHTRTNSSSKGIWKQEICTCIQTTEEPPQPSSKVIEKISLYLWTLWNKPPYLQCVDQRPGKQRLFLGLGGFILSRYLNQLQQENFFQQVHSWFEVKETLFTPTEWKWEWLCYIKLTTSLHNDTWMIEEFTSSKSRRNNKKIKKPTIQAIKRSKMSSPSWVSIHKPEKYFIQ